MKNGRAPKVFRALFAIVLTLALVFGNTVYAQGQSPSSNRYNVVLVTDASGSMSNTDPQGLRFEAMNQFVNLLADSGNYLGGVAFTQDIAARENVAPANSPADKARVINTLAAIPANGDTNIGAALSTAMDMLDKDGNKDLPSVIVLLSDGNTDLPNASKEELQASLDAKADAVQRAREEGVRIYTVCLNANNDADTSEMRQISDATNGVFSEVKRAEDLQDVFNAFYSLIYGTSTVPIEEGVFPENGRLETTFSIPAMGVEEVNIILYGNATTHTLTDPSGKFADAAVTKASTFTLIKITDVMPGTWKLVTEGIPGDAIKINMVFNTSLGIRIEVEPSETLINPEDALTVRAYLNEAGKEAQAASQYNGYTAELQVLNSLDDAVLETVPMELASDHFEVTHKLAEGTYRLRANVTGNYLERASEVIGPLTVSANATSEAVRNNTPPTPVANPLETTLVIWPTWSPIGEKTYKLDLTTLAIDEQDDELKYAIVSSSFNDADYTIEGSQLTVTNFSLSKGAFTIRAEDSLGASCDIEVIVNSHNVATIVLIAVGAMVLIGLIVAALVFRHLIGIPFRGTVSVFSNVNGVRKGSTLEGGRGRKRLNAFEIDQVGLNYRKSYIQATGKDFVWLKTNVPVMYASSPTKKVRVGNHVDTRVGVADGKSLELRFESALEGSSFRPRRKAPKPPKAPKAPKPPKPPKPPKCRSR